MGKRLLMRAFCAAAIAALPLSGRAQANAPEAEVYAGVTKIWGHVNGTKFDDGGGEISATGYFNRFVGMEADFAGFNYVGDEAPAYANHESALFGPHFAWHGNKWVSPFGHVLLGVTRGVTAGPSYTNIERSAFTLGAGGGVDVKVWRFLWLRPVQIDYLREPFPAVPNVNINSTGAGYSSYLQNNLRLSAGAVVRFGSFRKRGEP